MKFGYFSHVWGRDDRTPAERLRELWREIALADRVGFDYAFSVEHHFTPHESWMPSPPVYCAGAALCTERIRVGPMGYVPSLHDPLRIAEEVATLDHALGGRLDVGLSSGVASSFFGPFRADFEQRRERTRECVELLRVALDADKAFSYRGPFHEYHDVTLSFGSLQRPHPPLWVPSRDRRMLRWLAEIGAYTSSTMQVPRRALDPLNRLYLDRWRRHGHPEPPRIGYWSLVYVGDSDDAAVRTAAPHITHTLTSTLGYGRSPAPTDAAELNTATILARAGDLDFLLDHNLIFVGAPDTVADRIRAAAAEGMFDTLLAELNLGVMDEPTREASVRLFAEEVMPRLRGFSPY